MFSPPVFVLMIQYYLCHLLPRPTLMANRTIICKNLIFGNIPIKREWRECHIKLICFEPSGCIAEKPSSMALSPHPPLSAAAVCYRPRSVPPADHAATAPLGTSVSCGLLYVRAIVSRYYLGISQVVGGHRRFVSGKKGVCFGYSCFLLSYITYYDSVICQHHFFWSKMHQRSINL
jgi:hypothetical protein